MFEEDRKPYEPKLHIVAFIEILGYNEIIEEKNYEEVHSFYAEVSEQFYKIRNKNYLWGFHVIEPEIGFFGDKISMHSRIYEGKNYKDLNSLIFKHFIDFSRVLISIGLKNEVPMRGLINIGDFYSGFAESKKTELIPKGDPLILKDLLNVFSVNDIFPEGLKDCLVPKFRIPIMYGDAIKKVIKEIVNINSVGIFMPPELIKHSFTEIALLSEMLIETRINKQNFYACNWINWIHANYGSETINSIIDFAEQQTDCESMRISGKWESFLDYSNDL